MCPWAFGPFAGFQAALPAGDKSSETKADTMPTVKLHNDNIHLNDEFMTIEHLLLALLDNPTAAQVLRACGADIDALRNDIDSFLEETTPLIIDDAQADEIVDTVCRSIEALD